MLIERPTEITIDTAWCADEWPCEYEATWVEGDEAESGGWECEFVAGCFGSLKITRTMLIEATCRATVDAIETRAAAYLDEHYRGYADLAA